MATYEDLYGKRIKVFDSDPTLTSSYEGQVWYDSSTGNLKSVVATSAWSSTSPIIAITSVSAGAGTQTAGLIFGGYDGDASDETNTTLEYNGTGFSTSGNLNQARFGLSGFGTQTAAVGACGYNNAFPAGSAFLTNSEEYDGSSWTAGNAAGTQAHSRSSAGILTAGVVVGGRLFGSTASANSEEYDGTSYSEGNNLSTARWGLGGAGAQTAAIFFGGRTQNSPFVITANSETYDGTSYSAGPSLNTARGEVMGIGDAQTSALACGGFETAPTVTGKTESFDGTSFSETADLGTSRRSAQFHGVGSSNASGLYAGGYNGSTQVSVSEEFNQSASVITAAAWASGATIGTTRNALSGCGTQTASLIAGGDNTDPSYLAVVEEYNGTSWSEQSDLPANRRSGAMAGTQTAAIYFGGQSYPQNESDGSYKYDGSSWTSGGAMPVANAYGGVAGTGTQTAALGVGGYIDPPGAFTDLALEYDGSSWSANPNNFPATVTAIGHCGTQTAALLSGGQLFPPGSFQSTSFTYDGSSFSAAPNLIFAHAVGAAGGTQTDAIICTGQTTPQPTASSQAQGYDGTSWATRPGVSSVRRYSASGKNTSPASASWVAGGYTGSAPTNAHEEFTGETTSVPSKTLTTS